MHRQIEFQHKQIHLRCDFPLFTPEERRNSRQFQNEYSHNDENIEVLLLKYLMNFANAASLTINVQVVEVSERASIRVTACAN